MRGRQVRTMAGGRKGKYEYWLTEDGITLLQGWARDGLTDEQIASNMGICRDTLSVWKKRYPDISDTLKRGKEVVDIQVEKLAFVSSQRVVLKTRKAGTTSAIRRFRWP